MKFKCRKLKQKVFVNWKNLRNKSEDLRELKSSSKLFISESMCHENHQLAYKCRQLKNAGKIHSTWFWNNAVTVNLVKEVTPSKFFILLTLKNFLTLTIWMILLAVLHFKFSHLRLRYVLHVMFSPYSSNFL